MLITNKNNLPHIIEEWAAHDSYQRGDADYTATELILPPRILALKRKHASEIELDVTDLVWRLSGQAKHVIFQRIAERNPQRYIAEKRYAMDLAGARVSGQLDLYDRETQNLYDYKETSVWKAVLGDDKDWIAQSNINAFLIYNSGNLPVRSLVNLVIFKDWKVRDAERDPEYPQLPIKAWPLDQWSLNKTLQYIQDRVALHKAAQTGELPLCSPEERWQKPGKWAVMKQNRKTAVKLFDSFIEAQAFIEESSDYKVLSIEERSSEDTRCKFYCDVAKFCSYWQEHYSEHAVSEAQKV